MIRSASFLSLLAALAFACGEDQDHDHDHDHDHDGDHSHEDHDHEDGDEDHDHEEGEDHDHEDGDEDHDHEEGEDHEDDEAADLGSLEISGVKVQVCSYGVAEDGGEVALDVVPDGDGVISVRAWYGVEDGNASRKAKLDKEGDKYHGHVEIPETVPEGSAFWIEVETASGTASASVASA